jgi:LPXTG-motif cell wall-anchored protein
MPEAHTPRACLLALLASAVSAVLLPGDALAKFTCEERGRRPERIAARGLPASPIAGRSYRLVVTLPRSSSANPRPYLGAQFCGEASERATAPGIDGWFRRVGGDGSRVFALDVRFPQPGRWALSFMDLDGSFYDFGLRRVRSLPSAARTERATVGPEGSATPTWLIAGGALAIIGGGALAVRRRQRD